MRKERLEPDIYVLTGEAYQANATVLIKGGEVLLIDGMASLRDAEKLKDFIENDLKKRVRLILCTHYMSDHIAALKLFPEAHIIAHKNYLQTFDSQKSLTGEERESFVEPTIEISDGATIKWGRLTLDVFHNPGKTVSSLNIDIPEADLLIVGDEIFGNTTFLSSKGTPEMFARALKQLRNRGRNRVVPGHIGVYDGQVFEKAQIYLDSLQRRVEEARQSPDGEKSVLKIPIERCLAPQVEASDFEKEFHEINLKLIIERELFIPRQPESLELMQESAK